MDKVLVLKNTKKGLTVDTVYNAQDTLVVKFKNETLVSIPDNTIKVDLPPKTDLDVITSLAIIIGGLAGLIGAIVAFWQLFKRDKNKEKQIAELVKHTVEFSNQTAELIKQTKINEKRLRMLVKPYLWCNTISGGPNIKLQMSIDNRGELCFYDDYQFIEGDKVNFEKWNRPREIEKDKSITLTAQMPKKVLDDIHFKIKIFYHDQENFQYESIIEFNGNGVDLIKTIDK